MVGSWWLTRAETLLTCSRRRERRFARTTTADSHSRPRPHRRVPRARVAARRFPGVRRGVEAGQLPVAYPVGRLHAAWLPSAHGPVARHPDRRRPGAIDHAVPDANHGL